MTQPVSSTNISYYDPNAQFSAADACDSSSATCGPSAEEPALSPHEVNIPPVFVGGDAGAKQLVRALDESRPADCSLELKNAALSCSKAAVAAVAGAATATTVVGALPGLALAMLESVSCGKDLRAYYDCERP